MKLKLEIFSISILGRKEKILYLYDIDRKVLQGLLVFMNMISRVATEICHCQALILAKNTGAQINRGKHSKNRIENWYPRHQEKREATMVNKMSQRHHPL